VLILLLLHVFVGLKLAVVEHTLTPLSRRWFRGNNEKRERVFSLHPWH
jgi:hypothetical protein